MLRQSTLIQLIVGWVPKSLGVKLRQILYRKLLANLGRGSNIQAGVEFGGGDGIELGHNVLIGTRTYIDASGTNNRIQIGAQSYLDRDVTIRCIGAHHQIVIGDRVAIDHGVDIRGTRENCQIEIGDDTYIAPYVCIGGPGPIKIGKCCMIASHAGIFANQHRFTDLERPIREQGVSCKGIVIEDDCWIGSSAKIMDGVTIGQGSVIGAAAVVTKDIPPYSVAVGVPATVISNRRFGKLIDLSEGQREHYLDYLPQPLKTCVAEIEETVRLNDTHQNIDVEGVQGQAPIFLNTISSGSERLFLQNLLQKLLSIVCQEMAVETATILLLTQDRRQLAIQATLGLEQEILEEIRIPLGTGFAGRIAASCSPALVEDLADVEIVSPVLRDRGLKSMLGVPLQVKNQVLGVFHVGTSQPRQFTGDETRLLKFIADYLGSVIDRLRTLNILALTV
jgi:acetyltransferase-like isoleucine patch superfamily enzyme/putative methionine-R-sulfoxide reductase with GAF domain